MTSSIGVTLSGPVRSTNPVTVEFVVDLDGMAQLRPHWDELMARNVMYAGAFFQSYAWCRHVADIRAKSRPAHYRLCIAVVRENDDIVAIWPLSLQKSNLAWIARNLDDPFGQFGGIVINNGADPVACTRVVIDALRNLRLADGIMIDCVCEGSSLHTALSQLGVGKVASNEAPWINFKPHATFDDYLAFRNKKTRKNMRNALNRLSRLGTVEFITTSDPQQVHRIIEESFSGRIEWLNQMGKSSTAFRDRDFNDLLEQLSNRPDIGLLGFCVTLDGVSIASQWGFVHGATYYAYISARNRAFDECSVGRLHLANVIETCHQRGLTSIELMPPKADYKLQWTDELRHLDAFTQSFTALGRFDIVVLEKYVVPGVKSVARQLPQSARSAISAFLNRPKNPQ
jgi:CelD/BcsL family acetyltransferase involved in cellulose biosynthesis